MSGVLPARVAVVGAGTMGGGIAQVFAEAGCAVQLCDVSPAAVERARAAAADSLGRFVAKGTITRANADAALARITAARLEDCAGVDLVIEAIAENAADKVALFERLDAICPPGVPFGSNTSSVSITMLGAATSRPDRVVGLHFMNPVPVMPLVEVVRGHRTSDATMALARGIAAQVGKTAVESADHPGFISNRVLMPMINEAIFALADGVGTADAIDSVMTLGMRHPMGPLALADLIGLDVCLAILEVLQQGFGDPKYRPCPLLRRMVSAGQLGRKTGQGFFRYD